MLLYNNLLYSYQSVLYFFYSIGPLAAVPLTALTLGALVLALGALVLTASVLVLVCSTGILWKQSAHFFGSLVGMWLFGTLSDMFGRRKIFFLAFLVMTLSSIGCGLSPGFYAFTIFRVITSVGAAGLLATYVLSMEIIGTSYRSFAGMVFHVFFALGYPVLALMAYYIRGWQTLCITSALSGVVVLLMWRWVLHRYMFHSS